jgi:wyosine [tRNA(Phe)-imidazoG37] synthetase (radical SAM superfamily)
MEKAAVTLDAHGASAPVQGTNHRAPAPAQKRHPGATFGAPRSFLDNRFVYAVISQRARGLSIGVNMNPDKFCNFACHYCEVNRDEPGHDRKVNVRLMATELENLLTLAFQGRMRELPAFHHTPLDLLELKEVALSGNGEPTLSPNFAEIVHEVVRIRSQGKYPFFKLVLITNASGLDSAEVREGLRVFTAQDEVWVKLDAGTQAHLDRVNRASVPLTQVLHNIRHLARQRPVVIQSLFPLIDGQEPPVEEIEAYVQRLHELKTGGAQISMVQVYSAHRPPHRPSCGHLPLKSLSQIAHRVREVTGLPAEVF